MKTTSTEPMDASKQFCPNEACSARGQIGEGNIRIHSYLGLTPNACGDMAKQLSPIRCFQNYREGVLANIRYPIQIGQNDREVALVKTRGSCSAVSDIV